MQREYFTPEWTLKKIAKRVSRQTDMTHAQVLNTIANCYGCDSWAKLRKREEDISEF